MAAANWVNIIYGMWDRQVRRVLIYDNDTQNFSVAPDERLVRMPISRYKMLTLDQLALELML